MSEVPAIEKRRFDNPDQQLDMKEHGRIDIIKMADGTVGMHAIFEPGWTWAADEKPLLGRPLDDVLSWSRPGGGPTCYCEGESRAQKWGLVLETIHYALVQREKALPGERTPQGTLSR